METNTNAIIHLFIYLQYLVSLLFCCRILLYGFNLKTPKDFEFTPSKIYLCISIALSILLSMMVLKDTFFYFLRNNILDNNGSWQIFYTSCVIFIFHFSLLFLSFYLSKLIYHYSIKNPNPILFAIFWWVINTISIFFLKDLYTSLVSNNTFFIN